MCYYIQNIEQKCDSVFRVTDGMSDLTYIMLCLSVCVVCWFGAAIGCDRGFEVLLSYFGLGLSSCMDRRGLALHPLFSFPDELPLSVKPLRHFIFIFRERAQRRHKVTVGVSEMERKVEG